MNYYDEILNIGNAAKLAASEAERTAVKKAGVYASAVPMLIEAGSFQAIEGAFDELYQVIRTDGRVAAKVGAKEAKAKKDGTYTNGRWKIPSSLKVLKSTLAGADALGVDLLDEETGEAISFSELKRRKKSAEAALVVLTEEEIKRAELAEAMANLQSLIDETTFGELDALGCAIENVHAVMESREPAVANVIIDAIEEAA